MKVLVTGGAGFIGSIICSALMDMGHTPIILDSLITGRNEFVADKIFYQGDIGSADILQHIFMDHKDIDYLIHCAEKAAVEQSVLAPYEYYQSNVVKSMELFRIAHSFGIKKIIYSSSASIYDDVPGYMVTENSPVNPRSPYARTKYITEMILKDFCRAYDMNCLCLRCFNPIGADIKLRSGVQPKNPHSIIKNILKALNSDDKRFTIRGKDWGTRDGTCIRDYVHVWDLALAHVAALEQFDNAFHKAETKDKGFLVINIGSGIGVTVKEFILAFENVTGEKLNIEYENRRDGDIAGSYANISRARNLLGWEAKMPFEEAILDAIRWEEKEELLQNE